MSATKVIRNTSLRDYPVEYGGDTYVFPADHPVSVRADLADHVQYHHSHRGLNIDHKTVDAEPLTRPANATVHVPKPAPPPPPAVPEFRCPAGDWVGNTQEGLDGHVLAAHPPQQDPRDETTVPAPPSIVDDAPPAESPSTDSPAPESPSVEASQENE